MTKSSVIEVVNEVVVAVKERRRFPVFMIQDESAPMNPSLFTASCSFTSRLRSWLCFPEAKSQVPVGLTVFMFSVAVVTRSQHSRRPATAYEALNCSEHGVGPDNASPVYSNLLPSNLEAAINSAD
jgi:hypothetical protein